MRILDAVEIELLSEVHFPAALRLTEQSQWNQTERDWRRLLQSPPRGCFGAFLDGRLIGTVTMVTYGTELAWIGMMLIDPDYRHRGFGTQLMKKAFEHLRRDGVNSIKLDATPAGRPLYESLGFRPEGRVERWEGMGQSGVKKKWPSGSIEADFWPGRSGTGLNRRRDLKILPGFLNAAQHNRRQRRSLTEHTECKYN